MSFVTRRRHALGMPLCRYRFYGAVGTASHASIGCAIRFDDLPPPGTRERLTGSFDSFFDDLRALSRKLKKMCEGFSHPWT